MAQIANMWVNIGARITDFQSKMAQMQSTMRRSVAGMGAGFKSVSNQTQTMSQQITARMGNIGNSMMKTGQKWEDVGNKMTDTGTAMTVGITAPLAAVAGSAVKASIDFESAFAGVRKTVDMSEAGFAKLRKGIIDMSKEMPQSASEIANVAEVAGQLGIKNKHILSFTKTMVNMGVATNMSSEEAATALARLANITQMPQKNFDRLGSVVVELGNNLATTESEIVEMGMRIAGAGHQVGMTEAQILGFAGALSSVGIEAEAGGTAISRVFIQMKNDVEQGGKKLETFAQVAGMSTSEFKKQFKEDAAGAVVAFIEGLGKMKDSGENVFPVLKELGLNEIRVRDALMRASGAGDLFRKSIDMGSEAWKKNSALTKEAEERYKTTESQLKILKNRITAAGITLGDALLPAINRLISKSGPIISMIEKMATGFKNLSPSTQTAIISIAGIGIAIGPVLIYVGQLVRAVGLIGQAFGGTLKFLAKFPGGISKVIGVFMKLKNVFTLVVTGIRLLSTALFTTPIGWIILGITALIAVGVLLYKNWDTVKEYLKAAWDAIKGAAVAVWNWLTDFFKEWGLTILAVITGPIGILIGLIVTYWDEIKAATLAVWNAIKTFFIDLWNGIKSIVTAAVTWYLSRVKTAWDNIKTVTSTVWNGIKSFFSSVWNGIKSIVTAVVTWYINRVRTAWNNIKSVTSSVWNGIKSVMSTVWNGIKSVVSSVINGIRSTVTSIWNSIKSVTSSAWNGIKSTVGKGISGAWNVVKGYVGRFLTSGKSLMTSLAKGISQGLSYALSAVKNGMKKIRSYLPFSPAKEGPLKDLDKSGESFFPTWAAGVLKGQRPMVRQVETSMSRVASLLTTPVAGRGNLAVATAGPSVSRQESAAMQAGGVTIHIKEMHVREEGDIQRLAKRVSDELWRIQQRQDRRRIRG